MTRDDAVPSYASFVSRASNVLASYSPVTWETLDTATIHPIICVIKFVRHSTSKWIYRRPVFV